MTEKEIRSKVVEIARGWLGCKESDGSHKKIIDTYNACTRCMIRLKIQKVC